MLTIRIEGLNHIQQNLNGAGSLLDGEMKRAMTQSVLYVQGQVQQRTPVRTGTLRRSIHDQVISSRQGAVGTNLDYARFIETGRRRTRHGLMTRRRGPARMFGEGLRVSRGQIQAFFKDALGRVTRGLGGR